MKRAGIVALLLIACHREAPPQASAPRRVVIKTVPTDARNAKVNALVPVTPPTFLDAARLGAKLGADGRVAEEAAAFRKGEPVYLTLDIRTTTGSVRSITSGESSSVNFTTPRVRASKVLPSRLTSTRPEGQVQAKRCRGPEFLMARAFANKIRVMPRFRQERSG